MYIVHICSEFAPLAKVGGLADVVHGLAKTHVSLGHTVEVILPKYDTLDYSALTHLQVGFPRLLSYDGSTAHSNTVWQGGIDGVGVFLFEAHHPDHPFSRGTIYGCEDDLDRFLYFCRGAMEFLLKSGKRPDVIHVHDWPGSLVPVLYKDMYRPLGMCLCKTILTIHNIEHQGRCAPHHLVRVGLLGERYLTIDKMQDPLLPMALNLLKGAVLYSDAITTVSPTYRREIQTPAGGYGLDALMRAIDTKLYGVLNGIDLDIWNPATDKFLFKQYPSNPNCTEIQIDRILEAKAENRRFLRSHLHLEEKDAPLIACVTRLVRQKNPTLIQECLLYTLHQGGQFILLGSAAPPEIRQDFLDLQRQLEGNRNVAIVLEHNEALAHVLYAGADILVVPSLSEPCGLTQMIALRFGTIPVVRATGGLADTVFDIDTAEQYRENRNGFTFDFSDIEGVRWALGRAITYKKERLDLWRTLIRQGMCADHSWEQSAKEYIRIYMRPMEDGEKERDE